MVHDITMAALHASLRGLSTRRRVLAENIANVDTPGYLAGRVSFEQELSSALDAARSGRVGRDGVGALAPTRSTSLAATRLNGNNVSLDDETIAQTENELRYSAVLEAMNAKFRLLRTAVTEGR